MALVASLFFMHTYALGPVHWLLPVMPVLFLQVAGSLCPSVFL